MARELNVPVIRPLVQLGRGVESRHQQAAELKRSAESGSIDRTPTWLLMIYRDEYTNRRKRRSGITEVIVNKHRNGACRQP